MEAEKKEIIAGLDETREILARQYMKSGELAAANDQVLSALKFDPNNAALRILKKEIDDKTAAQVGHVPGADTLKQLPEIEMKLANASTLVQTGRLLYEMGRLDDAETNLLKALELDPANSAAPYYLDLLKEARYINDARNRERDTKTELEMVERTWLLSTTAQHLPHPGNPYSTNQEIYTGPGRQVIMRKLKTIRFAELPEPSPETWEQPQGVKLGTVLHFLKGQSGILRP